MQTFPAGKLAGWSGRGTARVSERAQPGQVAHEVADHLLHRLRDVPTESNPPPSEPVALDRHDAGTDREWPYELTELPALGLCESVSLDRDAAPAVLDGENDAGRSAEAGPFHAKSRTRRRQRSASTPGRNGK